MGICVSRGLAVFVLSGAFAAHPISAQEVLLRNASAAVSVDVLRHPVTEKVRQLLLRAIETTESGEHEAAIGQLLEMLRKYPDSAPYVDYLLGVEYIKTGRFEAAVRSFEQAVALLPHDAMTHYNLGVALLCAGDDARAAQEVRRALELDPKNPKIQAKLSALLARAE
jgi:Flp pilus assembly protein TadD